MRLAQHGRDARHAALPVLLHLLQPSAQLLLLQPCRRLHLLVMLLLWILLILLLLALGLLLCLHLPRHQSLQCFWLDAVAAPLALACVGLRRGDHSRRKHTWACVHLLLLLLQELLLLRLLHQHMLHEWVAEGRQQQRRRHCCVHTGACKVELLRRYMGCR
jgi:hypothetical protein